jgi:hypothetical protein
MFSYCLERNLDDHLLSDLVKEEKDAVAKISLQDKKAAAAGILGRNLGVENYAKFITEDNRKQPHLIWSALIDHFQSDTSQNHAVVYRDFLSIKYTSSLEQFITDVDVGISNLRSVGIKIVKMEKATIDETLLAEYIVNLLPQKFENSKEIITTKRPLDIDMVRSYLNSKQLSTAGIPANSVAVDPVVKSESAMKTTTIYCENGQHNDNAHHTKSNCFQLHPEKAPESWKRRQSGSKKKANAVVRDETISGVYGCIFNPQALSVFKDTSLVFLDSCCSDHMFPDKRFFSEYEDIVSSVSVASGQSLPALGRGLVSMKSNDNKTFAVKALHVPGLTHALLSMARLSLNNCDLIRHPGSPSMFFVKDTAKNITLFDAEINNNIYLCKASLVLPQGSPILHSSSVATRSESDAALLHRRAGHPSREALRKMFQVSYSTMNCIACRLSKSHRQPFSGKLPKPACVLDYVYMDLSGKITPSTLGKSSYYFKITDSFSAFKYVFILSAKSQAFEKFKEYYNEVTTFHSKKIINLVTDNGGEFCSNEFETFLKNVGIKHHLTAPYTPQQNSIAERGNRTTSEKARSMLKQANLPVNLWGEAVSTAVFYENITPTKKISWKTPHELWYGFKFNLTRLRTFGCRAFVNIPDDIRKGKFGDTSKLGILVGYRQGIPNWRILTANARVEYSHDVTFDEACFPGISPGNSVYSDFEESFIEDSEYPNPSVINPDPKDRVQSPTQPLDDDVISPEVLSPALGRTSPTSSSEYHEIESSLLPSPIQTSSLPPSSLSHPIPKPQPLVSKAKPSWEYVPADQPAPKNISSDPTDPNNILTTKRRAHLVNQDLTTEPWFVPYFNQSLCYSSIAEANSVPKTYNAALKSPQSADWLEAINLELAAMDRLQVWKVEPIPPGQTLLGSVWVFRVKHNAAGDFVKFKARLCAQGSSQRDGIDYGETYAPTGRPSTLRAVLAYGVNNNLDIHQMDVKNAFLNGKLEETVYLRIPAGLDAPPGTCLHLVKSIYGLKQAPRVWYRELSSFFGSINFFPSANDPCLFKSADPDWTCLVHVYVDDLVVISGDVARFKKFINDRFLMEDMGPISSLLGMNITQANDHLSLSQANYVTEILTEYNYVTCRPVPTPMIPNTRLVSATEEEVNEFNDLGINYRRAIGLVNWAAVATRPDIAFTVSQLSQHLERPGIVHWRAFTHLLRYLSHTINFSIKIGGGDNKISIYVDADFAACTDTRRSYSAYLVRWGDSVISWRAKKLSTLSTSTTEAEYKSLYDGIQEAIYMRLLLESLGLPVYPIPIYCDNQAAIALSRNPLFQQRTKHVDVKYHFS